MRSYAIAAIAAVANAGKVHEFFAESNFICELCKSSIEYVAKGHHGKLYELYDQFPKLKELQDEFGDRQDLINLSRPEESCKNIQLCEEFDILEVVRGEAPLDLSKHIEAVNSNPKSTWVAGENAKFANVSLNEVRSLMGTIVDEDWAIKMPVRDTPMLVNDSLPTDFDARTEWADCEPVINHVRDQSNCGSCWAHGTTEALNDRLCISSGGAYQTLLSVADTTACCNGTQCFSFGCNGGQVGTPWGWFNRTGVVTGGDYGSTGTCFNYTMEQCAHHVDSDTLPLCDDVTQVQPQCTETCPDDASRIYADDKHKASGSYGFKSVDDIKQDISTYGTVTAAFTVYEDFLTYKSGVYTHQSGSALGGHAIKCIGWGLDEDSGMEYWLCVNSWNNTWGDQGTFKIATDQCGISDQMHAGLAA